jgi:hypothetical protein
MRRALSLHAWPRGEGGRTLDGAEGALATAVGRVAADRLRHTIRNTGSNHTQRRQCLDSRRASAQDTRDSG